MFMSQTQKNHNLTPNSNKIPARVKMCIKNSITEERAAAGISLKV